jgi:hypothetical protein
MDPVAVSDFDKSATRARLEVFSFQGAQAVNNTADRPISKQSFTRFSMVNTPFVESLLQVYPK